MSVLSSLSSDDLLLVLGVDRVELLVDRVQLLVRALQLLVARRRAPRSSPASPRSRSRAPRSSPAGSRACRRARSRACPCARATPGSTGIGAGGRGGGGLGLAALDVLERDQDVAGSRCADGRSGSRGRRAALLAVRRCATAHAGDTRPRALLSARWIAPATTVRSSSSSRSSRLLRRPAAAELEQLLGAAEAVDQRCDPRRSGSPAA